MATRDLLIEIGTEELPPKALKTLSSAFSKSITDQLSSEKLGFKNFKSYASPRRLAILIRELEEAAADQAIEVWGPPLKVALDDSGNPSKAGLAFAAKNGIDPAELSQYVANDGKQDKLYYKSVVSGSTVKVVLSDLINNALLSLPIPKRMRWGSSRTEFVRPIHWLTTVFGEETLRLNLFELESGNISRGHRFHCNEELIISSADSYEEILESKGFVIADLAKRRQRIQEQVIAIGEQFSGKAVIDESLLDEVTALVEWPVALGGSFEDRFLKVPAEALISSMKEHQKYFHVVDADNSLMANFITVANIESTNPSKVIEGNERVIRPRLSDAAFFFETDCKSTLEQQRNKLQRIVFQEQLGSVYEKTERVSEISRFIAEKLQANTQDAVRAAELSKSDLVTEMVLEFDDMQGIAGSYYAKNDGENAEVIAAMNEQYMPRFAGDHLPSTTTGTIVAIADRLDTLCGIFGIGQLPTGSKDPFALRRASLGILRLIIEKDLRLDLAELISFAISQHKSIADTPELSQSILSYIMDRLRAWYEDRNISTAVFLAVNARGVTEPLDFNKRIHAVESFSNLEQAATLAAANKRVANILAKATVNYSANEVDPGLLKEDAELALANEIEEQQNIVAPLFASGDYQAGLTSLASLRAGVDAFFDNVMVNVDDEPLKNNRLALLAKLQALFLGVADISQL
ncbi:MAG: glycine--tRNA ligase subunit beta, partial [Spongiibacteraceae bacterium]